MISFYSVYMAVWLAACAIAVYLFLIDVKSCILFRKQYWLFLFRKWKRNTFLIATVLIVIIAPFSGDRTWDYFDAFFMSVLTYLTAPWVVGIFYKFKLHKVSITQVYAAFCVWLFSASWSYDIYLLWRDKHYPETWWANMILSSFLYWCGGLFWNLDWKFGRGTFLSFASDNWPEPSAANVFGKIMKQGLIYILFVVILLGLIIYNLHKQ